MSTIYIGERQSGKTTMLIEMSEKTGATIVVATYMNVETATVDCDCIEVLRGQQKEGL
jgi:hypothetical protein